MEITIYAKKRNNVEGKPFTVYLATLKKKDGTEQRVSVKFREDCGSPKAEKCPQNIVVEKKNANMTAERYTRKDTGEEAYSYTLWVSEWKQGSEFVDHSLDDFV